MRAHTLLKTAAVITLTALIAGCGGLPEKTDETTLWSTNKLYSEAQDALTSSDWPRCAKYFELLEARDPFGRYAQQAQLNVAYCYWKDSDPTNANLAIDRFIQLHPAHPDIAYAYYLKGLINFNDDLGLFGRFTGQDLSERDPKALRDAYDSFKTVAERYPTSKYGPDAAQRMRYIVNSLAAHEVYAADYYYRRGAYLASVNRAQRALKEYANTPATEKALHLMVLSYRALGEEKLADDANRVLTSTFPHNTYTAQYGGRTTTKTHWWQIW